MDHLELGVGDHHYCQLGRAVPGRRAGHGGLRRRPSSRHCGLPSIDRRLVHPTVHRGSRQLRWGAPSLGDLPVPQDYDGDGRADIGVYRTTSGVWYISESSLGAVSVAWGAPAFGDIPAPADYDGDGKVDIAIVRQQTGEWFVRRSGGGTTITRWGVGDARTAGDFDGNGRSDIAIWRSASGTWLIAQ